MAKSGIYGVSSLRMTLKRLPQEFRAMAQEGVKDAADLIMFQQLQDVPVDEGDLAGSIEIKLGSDKLSAEIGPGARTKSAQRRAGWRAKFTEFGTQASAKRKGSTRAKPFVFPSLEKNKEAVVGIIDQAVDKALAGFSNSAEPTDE